MISLYFDEADPKAQQMAVMVKGGISTLQRRQQAGEFGQQADLGSLTVTENLWTMVTGKISGKSSSSRLK